MKIVNCTNTPNFRAKLVAKAVTPKSEFQILEIDKIKDAQVLKKIHKSFTNRNLNERFPNQGSYPVSLFFINNIFDSMSDESTKAYMTIFNDKPSGIITLKTSSPADYISIEHLAAWKPDGIEKPIYNGLVLMRHLFEKALQYKTKIIDVTPGFKADEFYKNLGFEKMGFNAFINHDEIVKRVDNIDNIFRYEILTEQPEFDVKV